MARWTEPTPEEPARDLSVHELLDGPTQFLSVVEVAAARRTDAPAGTDTPVGTGEPAEIDTSAEIDAPVGTDEPGRSELSRMPASGPLYRRALLGALPGLGGRRGETVPEVELTVRDVTVDRGHLAGYDRVCGFRLTDRLPATYPHVMGFPLALRLMTAPEFPVPLTGLVHVRNTITVHRPIDAGETLDFVTHAERLRPHDRGRQLDVVLVASVDGAEVWRGVSTYLSRERGSGDGERRDQEARPAPPAASAHWRLTPRVGTAYARVSGDRNPIHTSRLGAKLFGFPRPIAHGMWSQARCLAALEGRLPEAYTVDVAFKLPVPLPSTVAFHAAPVSAGTGWEIALHDARSGKPHLVGTVTAVSAPAAASAAPDSDQ